MNVLTKEAKEKVEKYLKENECAIGVFVAFDAVATQVPHCLKKKASP